MPRGGKRPGAGRKKSPELPESKDFAAKVLERIGQGKPKTITNAVDFQLDLLYCKDLQTVSHNFNKLLDRHLGKPVQRSENTHNVVLTIDL